MKVVSNSEEDEKKLPRFVGGIHAALDFSFLFLDKGRTIQHKGRARACVCAVTRQGCYSCCQLLGEEGLGIHFVIDDELDVNG